MTRQTTRRRRDDGPAYFSCIQCGFPVPTAAAGTRHRNHCPRCLYSRHLDVRPGDRRCPCRGTMRPVALWLRDDGEWALIHRCERCGTLSSNRVAGDDDPVALAALAAPAADQAAEAARRARR